MVFVLEATALAAFLVSVDIVYRGLDFIAVQIDDDSALQEIWLGLAERVVVVVVDVVGER